MTFSLHTPKVGAGDTATDDALPAQHALQLSVNGAAVTYVCGSSIADLLIGHGMTGKRVAVEHNGKIVPRSQHPSTRLAAGDRVEIVVAVGGG